MEPGYETSLFSDPKERVYFDFWLQLVANIYLFPNDIMHRVVPQLARQEPAIKHAALAMAGMARALVPSLVHRSEKELHNNGPHYEFALQQYGRAIKLVRSSQPSSENMLWAIVCCVLFVTFECLHGDRTAALSHMNHAYRMMETYFSQRSLLEDGRVTESIRTVCPIYTEIYVDGLSEDMLVGGYVRPALSPTHSEKLVAVLPEFLKHLRKWSTAFQGIYDELRSHQHLEKADYHLYVDACNLRLQYLTLWNEVSSLSYTDIRVVIILTPSFREIVQLSRTILRAQSNCGGCSDTFSMDNGPTWPLLVTACRCRDANLRQEATELLGKYHRRDGLWDSRIFHGVAKRNMGIEMENVMTGDEYEQWSRMSRRELRFSRNGEVTGRLFKWDPSRSQWLHVEEPLATTSDAKLSREL
ncbi:hypothetical protein ColTof3_13378 [Colletotrichum tofieldiae]|nr:hypothetical protein ColTof3_13378 [Colletotrichum tofieldiae]